GMMGGMGADASGQNPFADMMRQMQDMQQQGGTGSRQDSNVIDGEAREITPEAKKIEMKDLNK
ncbi:MAG: FxsA family protein, partial [Acinetobacter sp.]|nr:FxsA family protein [Acinetobacter sp.]